MIIIVSELVFFSDPLITINERDSINVSIRINGMAESPDIFQGLISVVAVEGTAITSKQLASVFVLVTACNHYSK